MNARDTIEAALRGAAGWGDSRRVDDLLEGHRIEVLAEADLLPKAGVVAWLVKKAREGDPIENLASKADRGAIRPDNLRTLPPKFFEPGRTYTEPDDITDWRFRCDAITTHPEDGECTALGWRHFRGEWEPCAYGEDDFEIHQIADVLGEEATAPTATATPALTGRVKQLLDAIRTTPGVWTTGKAFQMYRLLPANAGLPLGMVRNLARGDLRLLAEAGHLTVTETTGRREYRLNTRKDTGR